MPDEDENTSKKDKGDDRFPQQKMLDADAIPCNEEQGNERIPPQK